jgi:hypothetical protein
MSTGAPRADAAAASVGATDLFVLRRVRDDRFVHFGGSGRGAGWAGLIEIAGRESDAFDRSLADRLPVRVAHDRKELVFGPYSASDEALQSAGTMAADAVSHVTPAKVLADELEELEAVRATLAVPTEDVAATMRALALVAAEALSCEVGAVYLNDGDKLEVVDRGWQLAARHDGVAGALKAVLEEGRFPYCVQDASVVPPPPPLDGEPGLRSYYLLELHGPARGVLFLAHTDAAPRGFTLLCRRLGLRLADVVSTTLGVALTREWCRSETVRIDDELAKLGPAGSA